MSTGGSLTLTPEAYPYQFAMTANARTFSAVMVNYVADVMKAKNAAVLGDSGATSKESANFIKERLKERGIALAGEQEFEFRTQDMTPQLLSLRRVNPEVVVFTVASSDDMSRLLQNSAEINWHPTIMGSIGVPSFAALVSKNAPPGAFDNIKGILYKGMTYCPSDPAGQSAYSQFLVRLKAFAPQDFDRIPHLSAVFQYDNVYLVKAAVEGTKSFDAEKVAHWIEDNGASMTSISGPLSPSKTTHHLLGPASMVVVDRPDQVKDELIKRAGC
jgi:ABC-type branched-subunit amino acid transport system substrate-binding protein